MYIVVGSITAAVRLRKELEKASGHPAEVVRTPPELNKGGCSYSVRADDRLSGFAAAFCAERDIPFKHIYGEEAVGGERVYHALS